MHWSRSLILWFCFHQTIPPPPWTRGIAPKRISPNSVTAASSSPCCSTTQLISSDPRSAGHSHVEAHSSKSTYRHSEPGESPVRNLLHRRAGFGKRSRPLRFFQPPLLLGALRARGSRLRP